MAKEYPEIRIKTLGAFRVYLLKKTGMIICKILKKEFMGFCGDLKIYCGLVIFIQSEFFGGEYNQILFTGSLYQRVLEYLKKFLM